MTIRSQLFITLSAAVLLSGCSTYHDTVTNFAPDGSVRTQNLMDLRETVRFETPEAVSFDEAIARFIPVLTRYSGTLPVRMTVYSDAALTPAQKTAILEAARHIRPEALRIAFEPAGPLTYTQGGVDVRIAADKPDVYRTWYDTRHTDDDFGSAMAVGLAQQAHNPVDLVRPRELDAPNPQAAVGAVERYQKGMVRPLSDTSLEAGGSQSN